MAKLFNVSCRFFSYLQGSFASGICKIILTLCIFNIHFLTVSLSFDKYFDCIFSCIYQLLIHFFIIRYNNHPSKYFNKAVFDYVILT